MVSSFAINPGQEQPILAPVGWSARRLGPPFIECVNLSTALAGDGQRSRSRLVSLISKMSARVSSIGAPLRPELVGCGTAH